MLSAFTSFNFDSVNVLMILIVTVISFLAGKFVRDGYGYVSAVGLFVAALTLFELFDWA